VRRFHFGLRFLFLAVVLVSAACCVTRLWIDENHADWLSEQAAIQEIRALGGDVSKRNIVPKWVMLGSESAQYFERVEHVYLPIMTESKLHYTPAVKRCLRLFTRLTYVRVSGNFIDTMAGGDSALDMRELEREFPEVPIAVNLT
jgi:hypothetical protein